MNSDAVREALKKADKRQVDLAKAMSVSRQQISNKLRKNTWNVNDLVRLAILCGGVLGITYPDGETIIFTDDSKTVKERTSSHKKAKPSHEPLSHQGQDPASQKANTAHKKKNKKTTQTALQKDATPINSFEQLSLFSELEAEE